MFKRIFIIVILCISIASCSYQAIQPAQLSLLMQNPRIVENKNNYELYLSQPQNMEQLSYATNSVKRTEVKGGDLVVTFSKKEGRLFVGLKTGLLDTLKISNNRIYFKKAPNFRDLGGIKTVEGKTIQWGKIFRSGHLNGMQKRDLEIFGDLNIQTVIDLRTPTEIAKKPDRFPLHTNYYKFNAFEEEQEQLSKTRKAVFKGEINPAESTELLKAFYRYYPTVNTEVIKEIIKTVLNQDHAVVFHCSAGKDRTGIIGALVLSILKVDRETIYQEYLLSNNYRQQGIENQLRWLKLGHLIYPSLDQQVIENFSYIQKAYLQASFDEIELKYGSIDQYIEQVLGISQSDRQQYINRFTY